MEKERIAGPTGRGSMAHVQPRQAPEAAAAQGADIPMDRLIPIGEVCSISGYGRSSVFKFSAQGSFPAPVRLSRRCVRWSELAVRKWVNERVSA
jgi:prophage regulatory protein